MEILETPGSPPPQVGETGCPPPLAWQDVLRDFMTQSEAWYLDRPGYRLMGRTWGNGRPLYFLNGIGGTLKLYALLVWLLRDEFRCVLYDYPGTSGRERAAGRPSLENYAADLLAVADACGDREFDLYATSFGGLIALRTMNERPLRVRRTILQASGAHRELSAAERLLVRAGRLYPGRLRHLPLARRICELNHRAWFPPFDLTRWQFLADDMASTPVATLADRAAIVRDADLRPLLQALAQHVLLVRAEGDGPILEGCHRVLAEGLHSARTESMHTTGQLPFLTHPHRLAKIICGFLSEP